MSSPAGELSSGEAEELLEFALRGISSAEIWLTAPAGVQSGTLFALNALLSRLFKGVSDCLGAYLLKQSLSPFSRNGVAVE